ncbi:MAG: hypothetical protein JRD05_01645 [Deltaproteobacteria bacterium]|nr:hypothetical protein [Deltaproteobacteria bacterium]
MNPIVISVAIATLNTESSGLKTSFYAGIVMQLVMTTMKKCPVGGTRENVFISIYAFLKEL